MRPTLLLHWRLRLLLLDPPTYHPSHRHQQQR
eukprot:COSAG01_NODE_55242_length_326_cov_1.136564_1_plen_31_part_10